MPENIKEVWDFYGNGAETLRLERGLGKVEGYRTKELLRRFLEPDRVIYDIGGGIGYYADWLAAQGHAVTLLELAPSAVAYAKGHQTAPYRALEGDARHLPMKDCSADVVLLMGPLYHLQEKEDRLQVLAETGRVLRPGGQLFVTAISKFNSMTWALSVYGFKNNYIDEPFYMEMLREELDAGRHNKPKEINCMCHAFFHTPEGLTAELQEAGFSVDGLFPIEGCAWLTPALEEKWEIPACLENLLALVRMTEQEPSLLGLSPHFLAAARKP